MCVSMCELNTNSTLQYFPVTLISSSGITTCGVGPCGACCAGGYDGCPPPDVGWKAGLTIGGG